MKKNKMMISVILSTLFFTTPVAAQNSRNAVKQVKINRIVSMPDMPETYEMINWREKAKSFDAYVFDWNNKGELGPLIWKDNARRNIDQEEYCRLWL